MSSDVIVEFAQRRFGTDAGLPLEAPDRMPLPDWLTTAAEDTAPAEGSEPLRVEGRPTSDEPGPTADGTVPEALAFYLPFHFYRTAWGVYIRAAGVWALARRFALPRRRPDLDALAHAYNLLLEHERLHFLAEYAAARIEVVTAQPCYTPYFGRADAGLHEEALANAQAVQALRRNAPSKFLEAPEAWMATQGPGYSDFNEWMPPRFTEGQRRAAALMTVTAAETNRHVLSPMPSYAWHPADFLFRHSRPPRLPVYVVLDLSVPWVRVAKQFPKEFGLQVFVYSNDHKPPHIHIESPPGTARARYQWPDLVPLRGDRPLRAAEEKRLRRYVAVHDLPLLPRSRPSPGSEALHARGAG